jgi:hypothetical protein
MRSRKSDRVAVQLTGFNQLLDLSDCDPAGGGHHGVEVPGGFPIDQVPMPIALPGVHQGEVTGESPLHHVLPAVEFPHFLSLRYQSADPGRSEEGGDAGAAGPDPLRKRALRIELDFELAGEHQGLEHGIFTHVARDHLADLTVLEQMNQTVLGGPGIVAYEREVAGAQIAEGEDQLFRYAGQAESATEERHPVGDVLECGTGVGENLVEHRRMGFGDGRR